MSGHGPHAFADARCHLCLGIDVDTRIAVESGVGAQGTRRREKGAIPGDRPLPGTEVPSQGQPFPGIFSLFIGDRRDVCLGEAEPSLLPSLPVVLAGPAHSTSLAFPVPPRLMGGAGCGHGLKEPPTPTLRIHGPWWRPRACLASPSLPSAYCLR